MPTTNDGLRVIHNRAIEAFERHIRDTNSQEYKKEFKNEAVRIDEALVCSAKRIAEERLRERR